MHPVGAVKLDQKSEAGERVEMCGSFRADGLLEAWRIAYSKEFDGAVAECLKYPKDPHALQHCLFLVRNLCKISAARKGFDKYWNETKETILQRCKENKVNDFRLLSMFPAK